MLRAETEDVLNYDNHISWHNYPNYDNRNYNKSRESLVQEIEQVNPKRNQPRIFTGRTDAEAEALILWPSDVKIWLPEKDPDAGKDWGQEKQVKEAWHAIVHRGHKVSDTS